MQQNRIIEIPQWGVDSDWKEANDTIRHLINKYRNRLGYVFKRAAAMKQNMASLFPLLDEFCKITCVTCPSPCCMTATVWLDYRDLLFLHLNDLYIPPHQLIEKQPDSCRFNSPEGCLLPRLSRPWVCTLYLCPPQMALLREKDDSIRRSFDHLVTSIKADRKILEKMFMKICC